jgi:uncharacterized phage-associated protein
MGEPFKYDIEKTIAAVAYLMQQEHGKLDMFVSIKMLYLADKNAFVSWGKSITGDTFVSMPRGPVLSKTYNLFKGTGTAKDRREWNSYFSETVNNSIRLLKPANIDKLSEEEMEVLEKARLEVNSCAPWDVAKWLHESCPEWTDPNGSSRPIDPAVILRNAGRTEDEIKMIKESTDTFNRLEEVFSKR